MGILALGAVTGFLPVALGVSRSGASVTALQRIAIAHREMAKIDAARRASGRADAVSAEQGGERGFIVVDKRGSDEPEAPAAKRGRPARRGARALPKPDFAALADLARPLGALPPRSRAGPADRAEGAARTCALARQTIDILEMLEEKTRGNLTERRGAPAAGPALRPAHALRRAPLEAPSRSAARCVSPRPPRSTSASASSGAAPTATTCSRASSCRSTRRTRSRTRSSSRCGREPGVALSRRGGGPDVPADARNLACARGGGASSRARRHRAASRSGSRSGCPSGAGLGGGSSDAAAVLRGLAALLPRRHLRGRARRGSRSASAPTCRSSSTRGRPR